MLFKHRARVNAEPLLPLARAVVVFTPLQTRDALRRESVVNLRRIFRSTHLKFAVLSVYLLYWYINAALTGQL